MLKRVQLLLVLVIFIVSSFAIAADQEQKPVVSLTPQKIVELAQQQNLKLEIAKMNLENARIDYKKNKANNLLTESRYTKLNSELQLQQAENDYQNAENEVLMDVLTRYLQLIEAKQQVKINEKQVELEKKVLDVTKSQVEAGHKGRLDLLDQQSKYDNAVFNYNKTQEDYGQLGLELKNQLGLTADAEVEIPQIDVEKVWKISEDEATKKALEHSVELKMKAKEVELAKVDLERAKVASTPELDLKKIENNLKLTELNQKQTREDLQNNVQKQYYGYSQACQKLDLSKQNLDQAQQNYKIIKEQMDAGFKTENDLLTAELNMIQSQYDLQVAITNYYQQQMTLKQMTGQEIRGLEDESDQEN